MSILKAIDILEKKISSKEIEEAKDKLAISDDAKEVSVPHFSIYVVKDSKNLERIFRRRLRTSFGGRIEWLKQSLKMLEEYHLANRNEGLWQGFGKIDGKHYDFLVDSQTESLNVYHAEQ